MSSRSRSKRLLNTKRLAGAAVMTAGTSMLAAAPALATSTQFYVPAWHKITWPDRSYTATWQHKYSMQYAHADKTPSGSPANYGGRPVLYRSDSPSGDYYPSVIPSPGPGAGFDISGPYGTAHNKTLFCGPFSTNAYFSCVGKYP